MISIQQFSKILIKLFFFSIPFGFIDLFFSQLNISFAVLLLIIFFDLVVIKKYKNEFKSINIVLLLSILVFINSIVNYVPDYPGGWSFLRQFLLFVIGLYSLCRVLVYSKLQANDIENIFIDAVFLLSVFNVLGLGVGYLDNRLSLFGMNPNIIGFFAIIAIIFLNKNYFSENEKKKSLKITILYSISILYMLFLTGSRGGIISLLLIIILTFYFKEKFFLKRVKYILLSLVVSLFLYFIVINNELLNSRFFGSDEETDTGRLLLWESVISIFKTNPIFGVGVFKYQHEIQSLNNDRIINTHNEFLTFLVYTGIIGLAIFIYFLYKLLRLSITKYKLLNDPTFIILFLILVFNLFKAGGLILSPLVWSIFCYILVYTTVNNKKVI